VAQWLNTLGVSASYCNTVWVRPIATPMSCWTHSAPSAWFVPRAGQYGLLPDRIGIMGFSAGGHLASSAGTHFDAGNPSATDPIDRAGSRPDFLVLCYPVISFTNYVHRGSMTALLGEKSRPPADRGFVE